MSSTMRSAWVLAGLLGLACRPPELVVPTLTVEPVEVAPLGDDVFLQVGGQGASEAEAYAAATRALAERLLADPAWAELVALEVHERGVDPEHARPADGGVEMMLGLSRARAAAVLSAFEQGEFAARGPVPWQETLHIYLRSHIAAHACLRRRELFGSACETGDTTEVDTALARLGAGLALVPVYPGGVPVDRAGVPLREPEVFVLWSGVPLSEMPVVVEAPPEAGVVETHVHSDAQGRARVRLGDGVVLSPLRLRIDGDALLGPRREHVPAAGVTIEPRAVGPKRWAVAVSRQSKPRPSDEAAAVLGQGMAAAGFGAPAALSAAQARSLLEVKGEPRARRAKQLADATAGKIDVVLVLIYETRFARRMGGSRVWYEAEGELEARDLWTGEVLARSQAKVEADGVGEERADQAARQRLAEALIGPVVEAL